MPVRSMEPFLRFSLAVLCPQPRGHENQGNKEEATLSTLGVSSKGPRNPSSHPALQPSAAPRPSEGGDPGPCAVPSRGLRGPQPNPDKEIGREAGALAKLSAPGSRFPTSFSSFTAGSSPGRGTSSRPDLGITFQTPKSL